MEVLRGLSTTTTLLSAAAVALVAFAVSQRNNWRVTRILKGLPCPPNALPLLGHALQLSKAPWLSMQAWLRLFPDSPIVRFKFLTQNAILIKEPEHNRHVLDKKQRNYAKDVDLGYKAFLDILGQGIITSHGDRWRAKRTLVAHAFRIEILEDTADIAKRAVDRLSAKLEKLRGTGQSVEIAEQFRLLTLQVIGELLMSLSPEESSRVFPRLYLPVVEEANKRTWSPWRAYYPTLHNWRYRQTVGELNSYISGVIERRWGERQERAKTGAPCPTPDILEHIFESVDPADWSSTTLRDLRDEFKSFMLAGHETSASMLTWAMYELHENKDCADKLLAEGRSVFKSCRGKATATQDEFQASPLPPCSELNNLTFTLNTLKETLRRYSLVPVVARIALKDDTLDGVPVPAGTKVIIHIKDTHEHPKYWQEPLRFRPERFDEPFHPYAFLAFINGPRNCLGQHLALLESRIVLSLLMQRFKFTVRDSHAGDQDEYILPIAPKHGMHLLVD